MTRRRVVVIATVLALLVCVTTPALLYLRQSPLERAYHRLALGMTRDEVSAVIGRPPSKWQDFHVRQPRRNAVRMLSDGTSWQTLDLWLQGDFLIDFLIYVGFDRDGKAVFLELCEFREPTMLERLRAWLAF